MSDESVRFASHGPFLDRVDRYIARIFCSSYLVAFLFFFGAFVVIDLFSRADDFIETAGALGIPGGKMVSMVAALYLYSSPSVFLQVAPFVTVIGVIVTVARILQANELIPILMSGRSVFRTLRSVFLMGGILTLIMILIQELVSPYVGSRRISLAEYLSDGERVFDLDIFIQDQQGRIWSKVKFDPATEIVHEASLSLREGEQGEVFAHGVAQFLRYDQAAKVWRAKEPFDWTVENDKVVTVEQLTEIESSIDPAQIGALLKEAFDLSFQELGHLSALTEEPRYQVLLHYHVTFPLTNVLLILLALPFVIRYEKRSMLLGLAAAFFVCGVYFGIDMAMRSLGENYLHPVLAAWFTPIFFGALGISLFDGIRT